MIPAYPLEASDYDALNQAIETVEKLKEHITMAEQGIGSAPKTHADCDQLKDKLLQMRRTYFPNGKP